MIPLYGMDICGVPIEPKSRGPMADKFGAVPFSVLNTREGWWQDRKKGWIKLGIQGELGRARGVVPNSTTRPLEQDGCFLRPGDGSTGASVFDPVLCELIYRWFSALGHMVLDPFAGGSVRGVVASLLGRGYWGCDLSFDQFAANELQGSQLCSKPPRPVWAHGDACDPGLIANAPEADLVFTCPPYGSLERYSDDPRDLSTMSPEVFRAALKEAFRLAVERLKPDSFLVVVVGEYRDKSGAYVGFVPQTITDLVSLGLSYYNEAILLTAVGTLRLRVGKQFIAGRKLGKTHQNVLVFVKGDWKRAAERCGKDFK